MSRDVPGDVPTVPEEPATRPDHGNARVSRPPSVAAGNERYRLEEEIARGGMGRVVEAFDRELDRRVAIKEALTADADTLLRFKREIWITARLEHSAIVPLYDAGTRADGTPFYVMRRIGGRPLVELVEAAKSVEARLALVPHVLEAARAIAHAHQRRVVHRDLKPSNILVGELGETVVIDWGLAKLYGEIDEGGDDEHSPVASAVETRAGTVMGTPGFMPPEQVAGGEADPRVDVYALGATLYYVLARQLPHSHTSTAALLHAVEHPATPIGDLVPEVPRDLEAIVEVAISPDPDKRFADAGAMVAELERFLAGRLIASRRYTPFERMVRFIGRHRVAVITAVIATLALAIVGVLAFDRVLSERERAETALDEAVHEREVAQGLLSTMTLDRARSLVETNPAAAVALARSLATGPRWREVRAIVAAAQSNGVASSMAASEAVRVLALAPTAPRAAIADNFGHVWTYELETHRRTDQGQYTSGKTRVEFLDDRTLVISEPTRTSLLDLATSSIRRTFPTGGLVTAAAGHLVVQRDNGELGELDLSTGAFRVFGVFPESAANLALSPDGQWLLNRSRQGYAVIERATGIVLHDLPFEASVARWDTGRSDRFAVAEAGKVTAVTFDRATTQRRTHVTDDLGMAMFSRDELWFVGAKSAAMLAPYARRIDTPKGARPVLAIGPHGLGFALGTTKLTVLGDVSTREMVSPFQLDRLVGRPGNPYLVATGEGRLLSWRISSPPREVMESGTVAVRTLGDHSVLIGRTIDETMVWHAVDLATGQARKLPIPADSVMVDVFSDREGEVIAVQDLARGGLTVIGMRSGKVTTFDQEQAVVGVAGRVAIARRDGRVLVVDPEGVTVEVASHPSPPETLYVTPTALAVAWVDHQLWLTTPRGVRRRMHDKPIRELFVTETDDVFIVTGDTTIELWRADDTVVPFARTSLPIERLVTSASDHLLVMLQGGALTRIDLATRRERRLAVGVKLTVSNQAQRALVYRGAELELFELDVGTGWKINAPVGNIPPVISNDGRWIAFSASNKLFAQSVDLPETPAELAARMDLLTNAEVDRTAPSSVIRWRD